MHPASGGRLSPIFMAKQALCAAGDIGTSPLYVVQSSFNIGGGGDPSEEDIVGVISLIIWTLTALLVFK